MRLSIVVPAQTGGETRTAEFWAKITASPPPENVEYVFTNSDALDSKQKSAIKKHHILAECGSRVPCYSESCNMAAKAASGDALLFMDQYSWLIDGMAERILHFASAAGLALVRNVFFLIPRVSMPGVFLNEEADAKANNTLACNTDSARCLVNPHTALPLVNRHKFLAMGGFNPLLSDSRNANEEFLHRLALSIKKITPNAASGHWPLPCSDIYACGTEPPHNAEETTACAKLKEEYDREDYGPMPLIDSRTDAKKLLYIGERRSRIFEWWRDLLPMLGEPAFLDEREYADFDPARLQEQLGGIELVIMNNPYANAGKRNIYNYLRTTGFPFLCLERGALPDSWVVDRGFNTDSASLRPEIWDRKLTRDETEETLAYIDEVLAGNKFLERQGKSIGVEALRGQLGLRQEKVLFAALQNREDTTIKYFAGDAQGWNAYVENLDRLAIMLKPYGWRIICKRHPLDPSPALPDNLLAAPENANIMDLLNLADAVTLINSGVGVYAMMVQKPCFIFGQAFYSQPGLNFAVASIEELFKLLINPLPKIKRDKMLRFIHYLRNCHYCYGRPEAYLRKRKNNTKMTATVSIDFYRIRLPGVKLDFELA